MAKRIVSLVLCLIMVLGLVNPMVNAADDSTVSFDNVTFSDVTIDGTTVNSTGTATTPTELAGTTTSTVETAPDCDCGNEGKDIIIHADSCLLKKYYQGICKESSLRIWAMWPDLPTDAREYILTYLSWTDNAKLVELEKRLSASAFAEDSIITDDGTDITAVNVPEYGSLNVTAPSASAQTAVEEYVAAQGDDSATQLFMWDISIKTASGQEWQPNGTVVDMELAIPGLSLHKYATVYVIHVDDSGNVSKIPAQVTEDGKIAFETSGFSTFAGYTVDFEYEGVKFSIPGKTSIYLSEIFDQLRIPYDVADVTGVKFSDSSLITVAQEGSDWLLTSLKAFTSDETLTIKLNDGTSFTIKVTDEQMAVMYLNAGPDLDVGYSQGYRVSDYDGYMTINLDADGSVTTDESGPGADYINDYPLYVMGPGTLTIGLQNADIYKNKNEPSSVNQLLWTLRQIRILGGATVVIRLGGSFDGDETITIKAQGNRTMFDVWDGSLVLRCSDTSTLPADIVNSKVSVSNYGSQGTDWKDTSTYVPMILDGEKITSGIRPIIDIRTDDADGTARNVFIEDVTFRNAKYRAIYCRANELANLSLKDCVFESTVTVDHSASEQGGAAIRIDAWENGIKTSDTQGYRVDITNFKLENCKFDGLVANNDGGAIESYGRIASAEISNCKFIDCVAQQWDAATGNTTEYGAHGGAICFMGYMGKVVFDTVTFDGCNAKEYGGAVYFNVHKNENSNYSRFNEITFQNCTFNNCVSRTKHGGAVALKAQVNQLKFLGCTFTDCTAENNGGALSIGSRDISDANSWQTYFDTGDGKTEDTQYGVRNATSYAWSDSKKITTIKTFEIGAYNGKQTTFTNCVAKGVLNGNTSGDIYDAGNGGAIEFVEVSYIEAAKIGDTSFDACIATDGGSAIFIANCIVKGLTLENLNVSNCDFKKDDSGNYVSGDAGGTIRTVGQTTCKLSMKGCTLTGNKSHENGGGLYWNASMSGRAGVDACIAELYDCEFDGNYAENYGGGIYCEASMTVSKCRFKNNSAWMGGGIAQQVYNNTYRMLTGTNLSTSLTLDNQTWIWNNTATYGGGISIRANATQAIASDDSTTTHTVEFQLNGASVYQNEAVTDANGNLGCGGGIYFKAETYSDESRQDQVNRFTKKIVIDGDAVAKTGNVYKNDATGDGGGIYMSSSQNTSLEIKEGHVSGNSAGGNGGGIYLTGENAKCIVTGGIVGGEGNDSSGDPLSNTASKGGGIAISGGARIEMSGGEISYNNVGTTSASERQGGGIWLDDRGDNGIANTMTLSGGTVKNNSTPGGTASDGGGIFVGKYGEFAISNGFVQNNTSNSWGGGLYAHENSLISVSGGEISGNTANGNGGGIYAYLNATISVSGGEISNNTAKNNGDGGGIYASSGSTVTVSEGAVQNNNAYRYGGGVYANDATVTVANAIATADTGGSISGNISAERGGGIAAYNGSTVTVSGGSVQGNWSEKGGGLYANASTITVNGGSISENGLAFVDGETEYPRTSMGGGIYGSGAATITVNGGNVFKNEAGDGGGVWIEDANSTLSIYGGIINENTAADAGGGVGVDNQATATIATSTDGKTHGTISKNKASRGGGVYVANGADLTVTNGYITYNTASGKPSGVTTANGLSDTLKGTGGGVYIANGTSSNTTTFTLNGKSYAIYGNLADFAADDVFANGDNTQLTVPMVRDMDLSEYKFKPEGWFEDYPTDDTAYSSGLNLAAEKAGIGDGEGEHVYRYRNADPLQRVLISDDSGVALVNTANKYVAMTLGMPTAVNDTVVIDYGKPVDIHVLTNEVMYVSTPTLIGIGPLFNHVEGVYGYEYDSDPAGYGATHPSSFGSATIQDQANGVVRFSINTMSMNEEAAFSYVVKYTNSTTKDADGNEVNEYFYYYADVTIIPATTIYYEDDFQIDTTNGIQYGVYNATTNAALTSGGWTDAVNGYTDNTIQDEDRPGAALETAIDKDNVYGYDSNYTTGLQYSLGNAKKVTVDASKYATATFSFYGTGFDVISMTSANTGTIGVIVSKYSDDGSSLTVVENYLVDTYYGYKFEGGKWVVDTESTDSLYQVPVIKVNCKDGYGHYQVKIVATYADFFNHKGDGSYDFYLDAIRIYDPANDGTGNTVIQGAYTDDGEGWPSYKELRNMLIDQDTFNSTDDTTTINGVVFIDGIPALNSDTADSNASVKDENKNEIDKTAQIKTYMNFGPNNELYLAKGQAVAFTLDNPATLASVQIAMKSVGTSSVPVKISYYDATTSTKLVTFKEFANDASIATATDLYYDISDLAGKTVVIQNMSTTDGPILSITNIKTTYTEQPTTFRLLRTTTSEVEGALAALNAVEEEAQPEQQPGENTPEQNVPGSGVEENPVTGDMAFETLMLTVVAACVMMLVVLALPKARKRNAK